MGKLPVVSWRRFERFLIHVDCRFVRQKGSHRIYHRDGLIRPLVVPEYDPLPDFIVKNNLRILGISADDFDRILKEL